MRLHPYRFLSWGPFLISHHVGSPFLISFVCGTVLLVDRSLCPISGERRALGVAVAGPWARGVSGHGDGFGAAGEAAEAERAGGSPEGNESCAISAPLVPGPKRRLRSKGGLFGRCFGAGTVLGKGIQCESEKSPCLDSA